MRTLLLALGKLAGKTLMAILARVAVAGVCFLILAQFASDLRNDSVLAPLGEQVATNERPVGQSATSAQWLVGDDTGELRLDANLRQRLKAGATRAQIDQALLTPVSAGRRQNSGLPPMPTKFPRIASRVTPDDGVTGELYGPVDLRVGIAFWKTQGWNVEARDDGSPWYVVSRGNQSAVVLPFKSPANAEYLFLIPGSTLNRSH